MREAGLANGDLEAIIRQTDLADQTFRIVEPITGPQVPLPIAACPFGTCDKIDLSGSRFQGP